MSQVPTVMPVDRTSRICASEVTATDISGNPDWSFTSRIMLTFQRLCVSLVAYFNGSFVVAVISLLFPGRQNILKSSGFSQMQLSSILLVLDTGFIQRSRMSF